MRPAITRKSYVILTISSYSDRLIISGDLIRRRIMTHSKSAWKKGGEYTMADRRIQPFRPFFTFPSIWDEEEWPFISRGAQGIDVYETDNEVVVKAPVPGIPAENVEVTFEDGVLRIRGKYEEKEEEREKRKVVHQSQRVSTFDYATTLPRPVDVEKVEAEVQNGIVTVTAPLATEAKPRKISVKSK